MFGVRLSKMGSASKLGLIAKAIGILRKYGADAHVYLPGIGTVSGLTAGNYLDSAGVTAATVDNPVGLVVDSFGAVNATQATTANKPILRRGLLNQLLQSTSFTSPWATTGASIVPSATTYNNGDAAVLFQETAGGTFHELSQGSLSFTTGVPVTLAFIAKKSTSTAFQAFLPGAVKAGAYANFNLNSGVLGAVGVGAASSISDIGGGWYVCAVNVTPSATVSNSAYACLTNSDPNAAIDPSYSGTLGNGVYLYRAGLFQGTYTAQQIIDAGGIPLTTTAAASNPSAGKYSWQFDGSNDSLSLSALPFLQSDDHCVIAGFNTTLTTNTNLFSEIAGTPANISLKAFGAVVAFWRDDASFSVSIASSTNYVVGTNNVASLRKSGSNYIVQLNGGSRVASSGTLGASTITGANIGSGNGANFFNGSIYPVIAIKGTVSDSDLLTLERFVGQLSGVTGI